MTGESGVSELPSCLGADQPAVHAAILAQVKAKLSQRIAAQDPRVWSADAAVQNQIAGKLGWIDLAVPMRETLGDISAVVQDILADGFTHAVLLGMGGSSLAPEVFATTYRPVQPALALRILDNTAPEALQLGLEACDLATTLFVVSTKSGSTIETMSMYRFVAERLRVARIEDVGAHCIAITDPGSALEALSERDGFRHIFRNPPALSGRYAPLSYIGLVPAALAGVDLERFMSNAVAQSQPSKEGLPGLQMGVTLGVLAQNGRDKLTLILPPAVAAFGAWVEQLVAESTGKQHLGVIPVVDEPVGAPADYHGDRVFVQLRFADAPDAAQDAACDALIAAGHPVLRRTIHGPYDLAGEFYRWQVATAAACVVLGVNPFDEPNVAESKDTTTLFLRDFAREGKLPSLAEVCARDGLEIHEDAETAAYHAAAIAERGLDRDDPAAWIWALLDTGAAGDYAALLAFVAATPGRTADLQRARLALRRRWQRATTIGYGPRYLHSTGQLHKGGPNSGVFLFLTAHDTATRGDLAIPGESFTFGTLRDAQALADLITLRRHGRRAVHVHYAQDGDGACAAFADALERAATF